MILSTSSSANSSGICPLASISLISTKNRSSATCESVMRNITPTFLSPALMYNEARSAFRSSTVYVDLSCTWNGSREDMNADRRASDCFPLPPTPTSNALPLGSSIIRLIRHTCAIASSNSTRFIDPASSLYELNASVSNLCNTGHDRTGIYFWSPIPSAKCENISGLIK